MWVMPNGKWMNNTKNGFHSNVLIRFDCVHVYWLGDSEIFSDGISDRLIVFQKAWTTSTLVSFSMNRFSGIHEHMYLSYTKFHFHVFGFSERNAIVLLDDRQRLNGLSIDCATQRQAKPDSMCVCSARKMHRCSVVDGHMKMAGSQNDKRSQITSTIVDNQQIHR